MVREPYTLCRVGVFLSCVAIALGSPPDPWSQLNALLGDITVPLPDLHLSVKKLGQTANVDLHSLHCGGISIGGLTVASKENEARTEISIKVAVSGITLSCQSTYKVALDGLPFFGNMTASSTNSGIAAVVNIDSNEGNSLLNDPPSKASIQDCDSTVEVDNLAFTGTILNIFKGLIKSEINKIVNPAVCNAITGLSNNLTVVLQDIAQVITKPLPNHEGLPQWQWEEQNILRLKNVTRDNEINLRKSPIVELINAGVKLFLDTEVCGLPIGINQIIQGIIRKGAEGDAVNISKLHAPLLRLRNQMLDLDVNLTSVQVRGLDTFTQFNIFQPVSDTTLNHTFALDRLGISFGFTVLLSPYEASGGRAPTFLEHVVVELPTFRNIFVQLSTLAAIDYDFYANLPLSEALKYAVGCSMRGIDAIDVTATTIGISDSAQEPVVDGIFSAAVDNVVDQLAKAVNDAYQGSLLKDKGLQRIVNNYALAVVNQGLENLIRHAIEETASTAICNGSSIGPRPTVEQSPVDLASSFPIIILSGLIESVLFPKVNGLIHNGTCGINGEHARLDTKGLFVGPTTIVVTNYDKVPQIGNITLALGNLTLEHLDAISVLKAFDTPQGPVRLDSEVKAAPRADYPLRASVDVTLDVKRIPGTGEDVRNTFRFGVSLNNLTMIADLIVAIDGYSLGAMPIQSTEYLNCWLGTLDKFEILSKPDGRSLLQSTLQTLDVACQGHQFRTDDHLTCSSPGLPQWADRSKVQTNIKDLETFVNDNVAKLMSTFSSETFRKHMTEVLQNKRNLGAGGCRTPFVPLAPEWIAPQCIASKGLMFAYSGMCSIALIYFGILFFVKYFQVEHKQGKCLCKGCRTCCSCVNCCRGKCTACQSCFNIICCRRWFCPDSVRETDERSLLSLDFESALAHEPGEGAHINIEKEVGSSQTGQALLFHPAIPKKVRYGVMVMIFINICLFFTDHALTAASVDVVANVLGDTFHDKAAFPFGLGYSLVNLWTACAVLLVGFMATFSGAWPYLKLLLMAALWCAPPAMLTPKQRGKYFHWLDVMGKWSLLDLYVLVNAMVAFYVQINNPKLGIFPEEFYHVEILVQPVYGLYSFCFAVVLSLVLSHVQVIYHLNAVTSDEFKNRFGGSMRAVAWTDVGKDNAELGAVASDVNKKSLNAKPFLSNMYRVCVQGHCSAIALYIVIALGLMFAGAFIPGWTFITHGIAGLLAEFGNSGSTIRQHSMWTAVCQLFLQATQGTGAGTIFITLVYLSFAFVIPVVHLLVLLVLWYRRMTLFGLKRTYLAAQILSAFSALEVWFLGTVFTILQIEFISYSVLDRQCTFLKPMFQELIKFGFIVPDDGNCFQIDGQFHWGGLLMMCCSAIISNVVSQIVIYEAGLSIKEREGQSALGSKQTNSSGYERIDASPREKGGSFSEHVRRKSGGGGYDSYVKL